MMQIEDLEFTYRILVSCVEIVAIVLGIYCFGHMVRQVKEKHQKTTKYLLVLFFFIGLAPAGQLFDGIFYPSILQVKYGYAAVLLLTAGINACLVLFATEVFESTENIPIRVTIFRVLF